MLYRKYCNTSLFLCFCVDAVQKVLLILRSYTLVAGVLLLSYALIDGHIATLVPPNGSDITNGEEDPNLFDFSMGLMAHTQPLQRWLLLRAAAPLFSTTDSEG